MWLGRIRWQAEMPAVLSGLFVVMKKYKEKYWGKNMKQEIQFTEGKIFQPLFRFALPVLLAMCLQSMYGAVDLLIVGQFGVAADVSAVATGSQMMQMLTILVTGLAAGITILLGQTIGSGKLEEAGNIIGTAICFFLLLALAITGVMMFATEPFATVMHAPKKAFASTVQYVKICSGGMVFIAAYNVLGSIFAESVIPEHR